MRRSVGRADPRPGSPAQRVDGERVPPSGVGRRRAAVGRDPAPHLLPIRYSINISVHVMMWPERRSRPDPSPGARGHRSRHRAPSSSGARPAATGPRLGPARTPPLQPLDTGQADALPSWCVLSDSLLVTQQFRCFSCVTAAPIAVVVIAPNPTAGGDPLCRNGSAATARRPPPAPGRRTGPRSRAAGLRNEPMPSHRSRARPARATPPARPISPQTRQPPHTDRRPRGVPP